MFEHLALIQSYQTIPSYIIIKIKSKVKYKAHFLFFTMNPAPFSTHYRTKDSNIWSPIITSKLTIGNGFGCLNGLIRPNPTQNSSNCPKKNKRTIFFFLFRKEVFFWNSSFLVKTRLTFLYCEKNVKKFSQKLFFFFFLITSSRFLYCENKVKKLSLRLWINKILMRQ